MGGGSCDTTFEIFLVETLLNYNGFYLQREGGLKRSKCPKNTLAMRFQGLKIIIVLNYLGSKYWVLHLKQSYYDGSFQCYRIRPGGWDTLYIIMFLK